jgi:hypothetical protein
VPPLGETLALPLALEPTGWANTLAEPVKAEGGCETAMFDMVSVLPALSVTVTE